MKSVAKIQLILELAIFLGKVGNKET